MTSAFSLDRRSAAKSSNALAGVDLSSWLSWAWYGLGFTLAVKLNPSMVLDLTSGGVGMIVLSGAVAIFFVLVLAIQRHMRVSLQDTSFGDPKKLVDDGVFAMSRNPMYVAFLLPIASIGYYSLVAAAVAAVLYVLSMNNFVIAFEEQILDATFGGRFHRYCQSTPRWLIW